MMWVISVSSLLYVSAERPRWGSCREEVMVVNLEVAVGGRVMPLLASEEARRSDGLAPRMRQ